MLPGWRTEVGKGDDGRYEANGTWVHAIKPELAYNDLRGQMCGAPASVTGTVPRPTAALGATYKGPKGQPGTGYALEFGTQSGARRFFDAYRAAAAYCRSHPTGLVNVSGLSMRAGVFTDRRDFHDGAGPWLELVRPKRNVVLFVLLAGPIEPAMIGRYVAKLSG